MGKRDQPDALTRSELERLRLLVANDDVKAAEAEIDQWLEWVSDHVPLWCLKADSQRRAGALDAARDTLRHVEAMAPDATRVYEALGGYYEARADLVSAIAAYDRALRRTPTLHTCALALVRLHTMRGDLASATAATARAQQLESLPSNLVAATHHYADGELATAEAILRQHLRTHDNTIEAMHLLARIALDRGIHDDAALLLGAILKDHPAHFPARRDYLQALLASQRFDLAHAEAMALRHRYPADRDLLVDYAQACSGLNDEPAAIQIYQQLLNDDADNSGNSGLHVLLGDSLKAVGDVSAAVHHYRQATRDPMTAGDAWWGLANLKTYRFSNPDVEMMQATLVSSPTVSKQRTALCFALGCAFEQHRDYGLAFDYFTQGNQLKYATLRYQPEMMESNTAQQIRVCSAEFFERRRGFGTNSPAPILIVGLPRSGSTLLEQILASHPKVEATRELASVVRIVARLHGRRTPDSGEPRYPAILESMRADDVRALGEEYLRHASVYRTGKAYFIDKMPNNCRHVGLIHLMLPNAKIIDIRREPIACCVANFKQLYGIGQEFSYRWSDLGRYYQSYLGLMRHWDRVLPGKVHHVYLEDLIANPEAEIRRLLAYCDLEFDARCLQFHKTRRVIATASAVQVRSPISAIGQQNWRHYEGHLAELRLALGDAVTAYRD